MTGPPMTGPPDFDALYGQHEDPWRVRTSWYERRKRDVLLASLTQERYAVAWDPACGTGDVALALSRRCDRVLAGDGSTPAIELTSALCADRPNVSVHLHRLPERPDWTAGACPDLVVLGEFVYYLPTEDRARTYALIDDVCAERAEVAAIHWRHHPHDGFLSGGDVTVETDEALTERGWGVAVRHEDSDFVLAVWTRARPAETPR